MTSPNITEAVEAADDAELIEARQWPELSPDALQGNAGRIVEMVSPTTEADPAALVASLLAAVGCWLDIGPHVKVGNEKHSALIWPLIVGGTSVGAKGTAWALVRHLLIDSDPDFNSLIVSGLSSGEGLIEQVRDQVGDDPDDKGFDPGADDKRALIVEPEFASVLARMKREGNTLGAVLRQAWDGQPLRTMTRKQSSLRADTHHICVVGMVTPGEFAARLDESELAGGSINRLLPILSKRSKLLPDGGNLPIHLLYEAREILLAARKAAPELGSTYRRTEAAAKLWAKSYPALAADRGDGRIGQATSRAAAQVLRLSLAYALIDGASEIGTDHLRAALALWDYSEASSRWIFGSGADVVRIDESKALLQFVAEAGEAGRTRTEIRTDHFARHKSAAEINALLTPLMEAGRVDQSRDDTAPGRPVTKYTVRLKRHKRLMSPDLGKQAENIRRNAGALSNPPSSQVTGDKAQRRIRRSDKTQDEPKFTCSQCGKSTLIPLMSNMCRTCAIDQKAAS